MLKYIGHILVILLLASIFIACGNNDDVPLQESRSVQVGLILSTGGDSVSRAIPGEDGTTEGVGYENYIDIVNRDFRFYIFDANNLFVDELDVLMVMPMDHSTYYVMAELNAIPSTEVFKVVVVANWPVYPASESLVKGETTIQDVCEMSDYDYVQPFTPSAEQKIPMYGVSTYQDKEFRPDFSTDLEAIYMLRAMAKVEVKLQDDLSGYSLESPLLNRFAGHGMAAPIGIYDNTTADCSSWESMHIDHEHVINTGSTPFLENIEGKNYSIYLPEYKNAGAQFPSYISFFLNGTEYDIQFKNYINGKPIGEPINIVRNHHYVFTITSVGAGIQVSYTVEDWKHDETKHHWNQNYSYPTYENVIPWSNINDPSQKITEDPSMYYVASNWNGNELIGTEGAFTVAFKMKGPSGQKWAPALHGSTEHYEFKVYKEIEGRLTEIEKDEWIAGECWYQIKLIPKDEENVGKQVDFGITTTLDWAGQTVFLLINGENEKNIRWPNSGKDARIIKVTQKQAPSTNNVNDEDESNV